MKFHAPLCLALLAVTPLISSPLMAQATPAAAVADPARIAEARRTINYIFPVGSYRKMMGGNFSRMMEGISNQMLNMRVRDVVAMGGAGPEDVEHMSDATMRQMMEIIDPAFEQRANMMFDTMMIGMTDIMNGFEPEIRDALVEAYAAKFTTPQLQELNHFFGTPTGSLYATNAMTLAMDPAFMDKVMKLTPRLMQAMPKMMQDALTKTKSLPPRKSYSSLTQTEKDQLAKLLGLAPDQTQKAVDAIEKQQKKQEASVSSRAE
jgi:hypothetical protein